MTRKRVSEIALPTFRPAPRAYRTAADLHLQRLRGRYNAMYRQTRVQAQRALGPLHGLRPGMAGGRHAESNLYEGPGSSGYLCTGCLEKRIGRQLSKRHFTAVPINDPLDPWNTPRLADRLSCGAGCPICSRPLRESRTPDKRTVA